MSLHPIDISGHDAVVREVRGDKPQLLWVSLEHLRIDDEYQRPLGKSNWRAINQIAAGFDWAKFTPILIAPLAGGAFALIDGQHRAHAAALVGLEQVPAMVVDVPPSLQAAAFAAVNSQRVAMSPYHMLKAELAAGDKVAIASAKAVSSAGCRLMTYNASAANRAAREIYSPTLIKEHIKAGRDRIVTRALAAITGSERADQVDLYQHRVLRPWIAALVSEPGLQQLDLEGFVGVNDLSRVVDRTGHMREDPKLAKLSTGELSRRCFLALIHKAARDHQIGVAA